MRKAVIWIIVAVFLLGIGVGYWFNMPQAVQTSAAVTHEFATFIEGAGTVGAPTQVVLAPSAGLLKTVYVREGQKIEAGEPVLQMDDDGLRLQLEEAVLALNIQKKTCLRQNEELTQGEREAAMLAAQTAGYGLESFNEAAEKTSDAGSPEQVDLARLKAAQARLMLDNATVCSAIRGTVLRVDAREGELVPAGYEAAIVASMDEVVIDSVFADLDVADFAPGMEVQLYGGCLGEARCAGIVTEIVPMAKTQQSQTGVKSAAVVKIRPADASLFRRLGASVELKVITGRRTGVAVPIEALAQDSSGLFVYAIRKGRAYRTPVEVGVLDESYAEIKSGILMGDVVALNPTDLRDGERVSS